MIYTSVTIYSSRQLNRIKLYSVDSLYIQHTGSEKKKIIAI